MGRKKIEIQPITNERNRSVTFLKRRTGLFKKAYELGVLCSVDVAVIIFEKRQGHAEKLYQYCSSDIRGIVDRQRRFSGERDTRTPNDFSGNPAPSGAAGADDDAGDDDDDQDMADEPSGRGEGGEADGGKPASGEERGKRGRPTSVKAEGDLGIDMDYTSFSSHPHHNHPLSSNLSSSASALSIPSLPFSFDDVSSLGGVPSISTSPTIPISSDRHTRSRLAPYPSHSHLLHQQQSHQPYPSLGSHLSLSQQLGRYGNDNNPNKRPRLSSTSLPSLDMHHSYPHHSPASATSLVGRGSASSYLYDDSSPLHGSSGNGNSPFHDEHSHLHGRTQAPPSSSGGAGGYGHIKSASRRPGGLPSSSSSNSSTPQPGYPGRTHSLSGPSGGLGEGGGGGGGGHGVGGPMSPGGQDLFAGVFGAGTDSGSGDGTRGNGGASGGGGGVSGLPFNYHSNPLPLSAFDLESLFSDPEPPANPYSENNELMYSFDWPQYNPSQSQQDHASSGGGGTGAGRGARNGGEGGGGGNGGMVEGPNWLDLLATAVPDLDMGASSSSSIPPSSGSGLSGANLGIEEERGDSEDGEGEFVGLDEGMGLDGFEMLGAQGRGEKKDSRSGGDSDG